MQFKHLFLTLTFLLNLILAGSAQEPILLEHGGGVRTVEFSPIDSQLVASAGESNIIKLWNLQNGTVRTLRGHTGTVNSIAFSPNGELLTSVSNDRTIRLWNVHTQQNIGMLQDGTPYRSVAFSPDGQVLATGGGPHVKLWDMRRQVEIATLQHDQWVGTVAFSHDGQLLAAGDESGDGSGTVIVWDVQKRRIIVTLQDDLVVVRAVTFSPDDRYLASSHYNGEIKLWNVSDWERLHTIPQAGDYDIAFSPDGKMIASTNNGDVSLLWAEDGARAARLPGPTGYIHPVDFSPDSVLLAVGAEDGIVRIWRIDTSLEGNRKGGVQILHVDAYLQQLPQANAANRDNIPEPAPLPAIVRDFFELDPFYEQWIDVGGLPVIASAQVNPYALKEAAWLIRKVIGHRPDIIRAMVGNKARFAVIAHTEIITEIPEYRSDPRPDFLVFRERGWGGTEGGTVSTSEEDILNYPGSFAIRYEALLHELAHGVHILGLSTLDPTFDKRLQITYEASMKKGLWQGTYAASDRREYWAEATHAWFYPDGAGSFDLFGNTRQALKQYDPGLATLLAEVYGDKDWQYTPVETRTHQPHLSGFNPQNSPIFDGWPELAALYRQLRTDPSSDGGGEWINLDPYKPNQLPRLTRSNVLGDLTTIAFVNFTQADVLLYEVTSAGTELYWSRCAPGGTRGRPTRVNSIWLIKDLDGRNIAVFQAQEKIGRAAIGATTNKRSQTTQVPPPKATENVSSDDSEPQVLIVQSQRPPMYWIDTRVGTLHRLVGAKVESLLPSVQNATSLAVDRADEKLYWTEKTSDRTGRIRRANLDGRNVQLVKNLTSLPLDIALDTTNGTLYLTNAWGKVQRLNVDGSNFQPNLITELDDPKHLVLDVAGGKLYWTETASHIRRANLDGSNLETIMSNLRTLRGIAVADGKLYWTEQISENSGNVQQANLDGTNIQTLASLQSVPLGIAVDTTERKLYWTNSRGRIQRTDLDGSSVENLVSGLDRPAGIVLSLGIEADGIAVDQRPPDPVASVDVNSDGIVNILDLVSVSANFGKTGQNTADVNGDGIVNIVDLVKVAGEMGAGAAAPSAHPQTLEILTATDVRHWLTQAQQVNLTDATSQRGLLILEQLLAALIPKETSLLPNYPNPFNPETWIPYHLASRTDVTINIYNAQGILVRALMLGHQSAGYYTDRDRAAYWDGRNTLGEQVASGIYYYTLTAGDFGATRRMLILK